MSSSFAAAAVWGLLVLIAFAGWGSALALGLFGKPRIDFGLRAAWGMALAIFLGGMACLFSIASPALIFAFVAAGVALEGVHLFRSRRALDPGAFAAHWKQHPGTALLLFLCAAAALLQYLGSIGNTRFNPNDDFVAYFPFARQILEQGTLFDPFSTRRVMSFGGQSFLHAIVLAGAPSFRLYLLDQGICLLLGLLLVFGERKAGRPYWPLLLALLLLLTLPDIRANTYPQMSGVVVFYALYRTMMWLDEVGQARRPLASAAILALIAVAACTLRSNYIAVAVPMVALGYAYAIWKNRGGRASWIRETCYAAAFGIAFLAPWMVMSHQSSGTPLFPILSGHFNHEFPMLQNPGTWEKQLRDLLDTVTRNRVLWTFPLLFVAGAFFPDRGPRRPLHILLLSSVLGWVLLVHTLASDAWSFERYVYGFLIAFAVAVTMRSAAGAEEERRTRRVVRGRAAVVLAIAGQLAVIGPDVLMDQAFLVRHASMMAGNELRSPDETPKGRQHRALQLRVPPGEPLLVMVDFPFMFDFARNGIYNMDTAAAVSPPPGFPYFRGPEAVAGYLRGQSIRYVAFVRPERAISLFNRQVWERQITEAHPLWAAQARVYLDIFDNLEALAATRTHLYDDEDLVLLDLAQPATSAAATPPPA